jgi:putative heme iron utilization protein
MGQRMSEDRSHMEVLRELMESQLLGVLGTHHDGEPYTSLVGFAATTDLKHLLFATGRSTRKRANLTADARASMLMDSRTNRPADFTEAAAATAVGVVEEVSEAELAEFDRIFLTKHPHLESFVHSPSCVRLRLRVSVYMVVTHFQHVMELHVD